MYIRNYKLTNIVIPGIIFSAAANCSSKFSDAKLIVTTLGKDEGWSTKTELKVSTLPAPILELDAVDITPLIENNEVVD
jgi:hypothetical protein